MIGSVAGSIVSGIGASQQAEAQAQQAEYNATVARINARSERQKGFTEQERIGAKYDARQGQAIAAAAASGVDPGYGSAAMVIFGEGAQNESMDRSTAYVNAEGAAIGNENKARDLEAQAANHRKAGQIAMASSFLNGIGGAAKAMSGGGSRSPFMIDS
jgi:hypothetical protein